MARVLDLLPFVVLLTVVAFAAFIGYQIYNYTNTLAAHGKQSMAKRNITLSKDGGMRVGYKEMGAEEYSDKTQSWLVRAYNLSTWPAYKSRLWNKETASNSHDTAKAVTDGNAVSRRNTAAR